MTLYQLEGEALTRVRLRLSDGTVVQPAASEPAPPPVNPTADTVYAYEPLGAGGWVTGITISPDGQTRLARTDTLCAWRWDATADQWSIAITGASMPRGSGAELLDSSDGVNAIAAANTVAFMGYQSSIFKSTDHGATWTTSLADGPVTAPNSGNQRWANSRMVFHPVSDNQLIYGTVSDGLYFTLNGGATWLQVPSTSLPLGDPAWGIPCVAIDSTGAWYAAPYGAGVYRSTNQGGTWTKISSDSNFTVVYGMAVGTNGDLTVTADTDGTGSSATARVYRYRSGAWANLTPTDTARQWRSIAFDASSPGRLYLQAIGGDSRLSTDYGTTWTAKLNRQFLSDGDIPWLGPANGGTADTLFVTVGGLQFDPITPGRCWYSQGIGVWYSDFSTNPAGSVIWHAQSRGIEQLIINDVMSPPGGPTVTVGWDREIFVVGETS